MSARAGRKPILISVGGGGRGKAGAGKKRKRPVVVGRGGVGTTAPASTKAVPALFRSHPHGRSGRTSSAVGSRGGGKAEESGEADEYGSLDLIAAMGDGDEEDSSGALLAVRSLIRRGAAVLCPPPPPSSSPGSSLSHFSPVPFVLRPMIGHALLSTVTTSAVSSASDATFGESTSLSEKEARSRANEANRAASAEASTGLEIELARLRRSNRIRLLRLHGTDDAEGDVGVMESAEYVRGCREAVEADLVASLSSSFEVVPMVYGAASAGELSADEKRAILEFFVDGLDIWTRASVTEEEVGYSLHHVQKCVKRGRGSVRPPQTCVRSTVDYLVSVGVILPRRDDGGCSSAYWFTLPGMGSAARLIAKGRSRVIAKLRSCQYKEMKRSVLELGLIEAQEKKGEVSITGIPAAFVVRDLLSRGRIKVKETPAGEFIKLVQL